MSDFAAVSEHALIGGCALVISFVGCVRDRASAVVAGMIPAAMTIQCHSELCADRRVCCGKTGCRKPRGKDMAKASALSLSPALMVALDEIAADERCTLREALEIVVRRGLRHPHEGPHFRAGYSAFQAGMPIEESLFSSSDAAGLLEFSRGWNHANAERVARSYDKPA